MLNKYMTRHSKEKLEQVRNLRKNGSSINEISKNLGLPKTTVWHHIRKVQVQDAFKQLWRSKRGGGEQRSARNWITAETEAKKILNGEHSRLAMCAAMLYWAEGDKKACNMMNTDPKLIQLYLIFLNTVLEIPRSRITYEIKCFTGMKGEDCKNYWVENLKLDKDEPNIVLGYNDGSSSGRSPFGICRIRVKNGSSILKITHALIRFSYSNLIGLETPINQWIVYKRYKYK